MTKEQFIDIIMKEFPELEYSVFNQVRGAISDSYEEIFDEVYECSSFDVAFTDIADRQKTLKQDVIPNRKYTLYIGNAEYLGKSK